MGILSEFWDRLQRLFSGGDGSSLSSGNGNRLYVGNLSYRVKEEELRALFGKVGRIKALHLIRDRLTRRLKGYAFLEMSPEDSQKALTLNGTDFLGRKLVVSIAKAKKNERAPGQQQSRSRPNRWQKKRRSGPKAYGSTKEDTPVQRLE